MSVVSKRLKVSIVFIVIIFFAEFQVQKWWISQVASYSHNQVVKCGEIQDHEEGFKCLANYIDYRNETSYNFINSYIVAIFVLMIYALYSKINEIIVKIIKWFKDKRKKNSK